MFVSLLIKLATSTDLTQYQVYRGTHATRGTSRTTPCHTLPYEYLLRSDGVRKNAGEELLLIAEGAERCAPLVAACGGPVGPANVADLVVGQQ